MTRSTTARVLLMAVLKAFCQSSSSTLLGLLDGRDHASADVAFVAGPVAGIERVQRPRIRPGRTRRGGRPRSDRRSTRVRRRGCTRPERSCPWSCACPSTGRGWAAHDQQGSSVPSTMYCRPGTSSSATGTKRASARASNGSDRRDGPADRRLRHPVGLGQLPLHPIPPQIRQGDHHRIAQTQDRWPVPAILHGNRRLDLRDQSAQILDLTTREPGGIVHSRRLAYGRLSVETQFLR